MGLGPSKLPITTIGSPGNNLPELRISLMLKPKSLKLCRGQPACGMPAGVRSQWKSKQNGFQMSFINQYTVVSTVMHINVQIRRLPHIFSRKLCIAHVLVTCMSQSKEFSSNPGEMAPSCLEHMVFHSSLALGYLVWSIFCIWTQTKLLQASDVLRSLWTLCDSMGTFRSHRCGNTSRLECYLFATAKEGNTYTAYIYIIYVYIYINISTGSPSSNPHLHWCNERLKPSCLQFFGWPKTATSGWHREFLEWAAINKCNPPNPWE